MDAVLTAYAVVVVALLIYVVKTLMHVVSLVIADIAVLHVVLAVLAVHVALAVLVDPVCRGSKFLKGKWEKILSTKLLIVEQNLPK